MKRRIARIVRAVCIGIEWIAKAAFCLFGMAFVAFGAVIIWGIAQDVGWFNFLLGAIGVLVGSAAIPGGIMAYCFIHEWAEDTLTEDHTP